jgi:hypothetical protein
MQIQYKTDDSVFARKISASCFSGHRSQAGHGSPLDPHVPHWLFVIGRWLSALLARSERRGKEAMSPAGVVGWRVITTRYEQYRRYFSCFDYLPTTVGTTVLLPGTTPIGTMFHYVTLARYSTRLHTDRTDLGVIILPHWSSHAGLGIQINFQY